MTKHVATSWIFVELPRRRRENSIHVIFIHQKFHYIVYVLYITCYWKFTTHKSLWDMANLWLWVFTIRFFFFFPLLLDLTSSFFQINPMSSFDGLSFHHPFLLSNWLVLVFTFPNLEASIPFGMCCFFRFQYSLPL